jgi:Lrp/AsnC family leucine-responsive transcriptional regulator
VPAELDEVDRHLLQLLQKDCSTTLFDLGQHVGLSTSAVQRRITRLQRTGLIARQIAVLDPAAFGDLVLALVLVTLDRESSRHHAAMRQRLLECPAVQQCYDLAGEYDYAVILVARGMTGLRQVVEDLFMDDPALKRFDTFPVYEAIKTSLELPTS